MGFEFGHPDGSRYLAALSGLLAFHTAVVPFSRQTVAKVLSSDVALLDRAPALRADIALLSHRIPAVAAEAFSSRLRHAEVVSANQLTGGAEERIGAAYVAAGSVLGGRVIAARLTASGCDFPKSFFVSAGVDVGRLWRDFKVALNLFGASGADVAGVIAGALSAFALIRALLEQPDEIRGVARD